MITYTKYTNDMGEDFIAKDNGEGVISHIPTDPGNSDYQRYLRWLENPNAEENQGGLN